MLLLWKIRYLDTHDRQLKDRCLWLETDALGSVDRAAVEAIHALREVRGGRDMLRFRHIFTEHDYTKAELDDLGSRHDSVGTVCIDDYTEDENGNELTNKELAVILTGNPHAVMFSSHARQHDIEYALSEKRPIVIDQISLSQEQLSILGYFARDLREMLASAFYKDGPGSLAMQGGPPALETAVTDEEIRSFVTIFRRLYMAKERANFLKAVDTFTQATGDCSLSKWISGVAGEYEQDMRDRPGFVPFVRQEEMTFSRKRLIDVFLYTQYAHQPKKGRARQFQECLASVGGRHALLTWLFFLELHHCAMHIRNAGVIIAGFYDQYCQYHKVPGGVLASVADDNPGIGTQEKQGVRRERILRERAEQLAKAIWEERGQPSGGPEQFSREAREQLEAAIKGNTEVKKETL